MTSVLPDLERDLVAAASRLSTPVPSSRSDRRFAWLRRTSSPTRLLIGLAVVSAAAASAATLTGQRSAPLSGAVSSNVRYQISISPMLTAGMLGWCIFEAQTRRSGAAIGGEGACTPDTAELDSPLFASVPSSTIAVIAAPDVAAVRVVGGPTILTRSDPHLPFGFRAAVYNIVPFTGSMRVQRRRFVALDAHGDVIRQGSAGPLELAPLAGTPPFALPTHAWIRPGDRDLVLGRLTGFAHEHQTITKAPPTQGCRTEAPPRSGLNAAGGVAIAAIAPDPAILGRAFLDCSDTVYTTTGRPVVASVLLDAKNPGSRPAQLPGLRSIPTQPGVYTLTVPLLGLAMRAEARRIGDAWLVVQGTGSQTTQAIRALTIPWHPQLNSTSPPRNARCTITYQPSPGLIEAAQTPWIGAPPNWGPNPRLYACTKATFYLHKWPLNVELFAPINEPGTPHHPPLHQIPGHPDTFRAPTNGYSPAGIWKRIHNTWLTITGGQNEQQQLSLATHLTVTLKAR